MKISSLKIVILILLAGTFPALAQYDSGSNGGYECWQCPVCGFVVSLTPSDAASISAYTLCPACHSAYAGSFVPVSCQQEPGYSIDEDFSPEYGDQEENVSANSSKEEDSYRIDSSDMPIKTDKIVPVPSEQTRNKYPKSGSNVSSDKEKILMVLPQDQYQEDELNVPRDYFQERDYQVVLSSKGVETAKAMNGETVQVDVDLKKVNLSDYNAVVYVGGEGIYSLKLYQDPDYTSLAKSANEKKMLIGAICLGPWILADAGILEGKKATASETDHLKSKGAIVSDNAVVQDGNIITGNGPSAAGKFAEAIVASLQASAKDKAIEGVPNATETSSMAVPDSTNREIQS